MVMIVTMNASQDGGQSSLASCTQGQRVKILRKRAGEIQADVAPVLGLARSAIANIEMDRQRLTFAHAITLADHWGISLDTLAGRGEKADEPVNAYDAGYDAGFRSGRALAVRAVREALERIEGQA